MNIAFFAAVAYDSVLGGRTRRLADELAKRHRVFFVDMPSLRRPGVRTADSPAGVTVCRLMPMPMLWNNFGNNWGKCWAVAAARHLSSILPPDTRAVASSPFWIPVLRKLKLHSITYDCLDHVSVQARGASEDSMEYLEEQLAAYARQIVCVSGNLAGMWQSRVSKPVHTLSNGFPREFLDWPVELPEVPTAGFCGAMYEWFDFRLVEKAARELPDVKFILTGPARRKRDLSRLGKLPNVEIDPPVPFAGVPREIGRYTVGMIPFLRGEIAFFCDPLKTYEYLALGRPVVSSIDLDETLPVRVSGDGDGFVAALREAFDRPHDVAAGRAAVAERSWEKLSVKFERILE